MKDNIASSAYSLIRRKKYKKAKELLLSNRTALNRDANALAMLAFADIPVIEQAHKGLHIGASGNDGYLLADHAQVIMS